MSGSNRVGRSVPGALRRRVLALVPRGAAGRACVVCAAVACAVACVVWGASPLSAADDPPAAPVSIPEIPEIPDTWRELPKLVTAAEAAVREAGTTSGVPPIRLRSRAWGDPALGGYLWLAEIELSVSAKLMPAEALMSGLTRALTAADIDVSAAKTTIAPARLQLDFAVDALRGQISATIRPSGRLSGQPSGQPSDLTAGLTSEDEASARVTAAACFYNRREPGITAGQCARLMRRFQE